LARSAPFPAATTITATHGSLYSHFIISIFLPLSHHNHILLCVYEICQSQGGKQLADAYTYNAAEEEISNESIIFPNGLNLLKRQKAVDGSVKREKRIKSA
jgi:hypothetical protein